VKEHTHVVNAAVSGLSALPGTSKPFAATKAMNRFLNHPEIPFHALIEPAQDAVRKSLSESDGETTLVVHDWCMFNFHTHSAKRDQYRRSHDTDTGYELSSALVIDAADGRPLGPMELRLRTAQGLLGTRVNEVATPPGHVDELLAVMNESRGWKLDKTPIHVVDREADSVGHYREWHEQRHLFLVRADPERLALFQGGERKLPEIAAELQAEFRDVPAADGRPQRITIRAGTGRIVAAEASITLHRPAKKTVAGVKTSGGNKKRIEVPGPPLPVRLIVTRVVDDEEKELARWYLLTNVPSRLADTATIGRWYAWRWGVESYHKLLKTSGMNAEEWLQETGAAFLRRLCVATMACVTVWALQRDASEDASRMRQVLVRLSGRQMEHRVESTAPALMAGLERLLAIDDLLTREDLHEILSLARRVLPNLFRSD
jgi:hypothetical protein